MQKFDVHATLNIRTISGLLKFLQNFITYLSSWPIMCIIIYSESMKRGHDCSTFLSVDFY